MLQYKKYCVRALMTIILPRGCRASTRRADPTQLGADLPRSSRQAADTLAVNTVLARTEAWLRAYTIVKAYQPGDPDKGWTWIMEQLPLDRN